MYITLWIGVTSIMMYVHSTLRTILYKLVERVNWLRSMNLNSDEENIIEAGIEKVTMWSVELKGETPKLL